MWHVVLYLKGVPFSLHSKNYTQVSLSTSYAHPYAKNGKIAFNFLVKHHLGMYCDQIWRSKYFATGFDILKKKKIFVTHVYTMR